MFFLVTGDIYMNYVETNGINITNTVPMTKEEALARVQELSKSQDTKFVVYKKDGKFQKKANLNLKDNSNKQN